MMGTIVYEYHSVLRFPTFFSFSKQPRLGNSIFSLKDVPSPFERKDLHLTACCSGSEGNGGDQHPRGSSASRRTAKKDGTKKPGSGGKKSKAFNQEEIISLFRRIQTSISKEQPANADEKINSNASEESPSSDSILRALRGSTKQKGKATEKEREKDLTRRKGREAQQIQSDPPVTEFKLTRPPSKFVKRSPIPSPSIKGGEFLALNNGASTSAPQAQTKELELVRVEEMKLPKFKELARSRGIKGYSKLKKKELVQLLKS